jgi:hypothetical protein
VPSAKRSDKPFVNVGGARKQVDPQRGGDKAAHSNVVVVDEISATNPSLLIQVSVHGRRSHSTTMLASRADVAVAVTPSTTCANSPPCPRSSTTSRWIIGKSPCIRVTLLLVVLTLGSIQTKTNHVVHLRISSLEAARPVVVLHQQQLQWFDSNNNDHGQKNDHGHHNHDDGAGKDVEENKEEEEEDLDEGPPTVTRRQTPVDETTLRPQRGCRPSLDPRQASSANREQLLCLNHTTYTRTNVPALPGLEHRNNPTTTNGTPSANWRYAMEQQLFAHHVNGTVILTAATYGYRDYLRNFQCNMARVGANSYWVVAALDVEIYEWGIDQDLPIFLADTGSYNNDDTNKKNAAAATTTTTTTTAASANEFGSQGFRTVTKLKSATVLQVLELGYSVVWSDLDIAWFDDPLTTLQGYLDKGELAIQSNAPFVETGGMTQPHPTVDKVQSDHPAGYRRLNSGLYAAPNTPVVRQAFRDIVAHARTSDKSEQPSFDEILCHSNGSRRYKSRCFYTRENGQSLIVRLLNRFQFPNGAVLVSTANRNVFELGPEFEVHTGVALVAAHNNWIRGVESKLQRHQAAGWWYAHDDESCLPHGYGPVDRERV